MLRATVSPCQARFARSWESSVPLPNKKVGSDAVKAPQIQPLRYFQSKICNFYSVLVAPQSRSMIIVSNLQALPLERSLRFKSRIPKEVHHYEAFRLE